MDLKISIEQDLWEAIEKNYENESYSSAILDAMHLLTDTIRNKTGLEGDGSSLIGQAFGGENPKVQLNKLQTESEKNVQKGIQEILRGLYTAIRNPRSHDKSSDSKEEADSIIYFIGYLLKIIDKSKVNFEEATFLTRVFDKHYVRNEEYSVLLVNEIPKRKRANIAISVILERNKGNIYNLRYFMDALFEKFEASDIFQVYKVVSEELKYKNLDEDIHSFLHILPPKYWDRVEKVVKMRIESMLLENVKSGKYDASNNKCRFGAIGTWIETEHLMKFEDINNWTYALVNKIKGGDEEEIKYVENHFWNKICKVNNEDIDYWLYYYISEGLKNKDEKIVEKLRYEIQCEENHPWWKVFEEQLKDFPEVKYVELPF
ncbi:MULTISPECIES: TIGR02391 family protein [Bacillaceae]|uniref:TIGR02391 family protein n=1 Tax=Bacillaceae TaxID=186817 RepID=UPI00066139CD|nr:MULTISPECIES: TIGR02391 family protein [Bacillaceae]MCF7622533.1 TIGR02391 family protein [Peribacillus frigoritolerans]PRA80901.1 TIGR02391 family protein [Peribacillus simplex]